MRRTVTMLIILSAAIYGLQLIIFRDPQTTAFYIFQDMAFMPFTIAIATIVVGEVMNDRERKERLEKTQMLTSSFFTELGAELLFELTDLAEADDTFIHAFESTRITDESSLHAMQELTRNSKFKIHLTEESYNSIRTMIREHRTMLLVISSNPLLLEHEDFTNMLWSIFHLLDEFRLRGDYQNFSQQDLSHIETDLAETMQLLIISWYVNILYTKNHYPNFFNTALSKFRKNRGRKN